MSSAYGGTRFPLLFTLKSISPQLELSGSSVLRILGERNLVCTIEAFTLDFLETTFQVPFCFRFLTAVYWLEFYGHLFFFSLLPIARLPFIPCSISINKSPILHMVLVDTTSRADVRLKWNNANSRLSVSFVWTNCDPSSHA
ncbi:hypothetical protein I7I50_11867 [Histoplasma capsulatum G186AR]|nr:hypothetical protein I7I50_11867 [Histoplasma capsulatum G186AR]